MSTRHNHNGYHIARGRDRYQHTDRHVQSTGRERYSERNRNSNSNCDRHSSRSRSRSRSPSRPKLSGRCKPRPTSNQNSQSYDSSNAQQRWQQQQQQPIQLHANPHRYDRATHKALDLYANAFKAAILSVFDSVDIGKHFSALSLIDELKKNAIVWPRILQEALNTCHSCKRRIEGGLFMTCKALEKQKALTVSEVGGVKTFAANGAQFKKRKERLKSACAKEFNGGKGIDANHNVSGSGTSTRAKVKIEQTSGIESAPLKSEPCTEQLYKSNSLPRDDKCALTMKRLENENRDLKLLVAEMQGQVGESVKTENATFTTDSAAASDFDAYAQILQLIEMQKAQIVRLESEITALKQQNTSYKLVANAALAQHRTGGQPLRHTYTTQKCDDWVERTETVIQWRDMEMQKVKKDSKTQFKVSDFRPVQKGITALYRPRVEQFLQNQGTGASFANPYVCVGDELRLLDDIVERYVVDDTHRVPAMVGQFAVRCTCSIIPEHTILGRYIGLEFEEGEWNNAFDGTAVGKNHGEYLYFVDVGISKRLTIDPMESTLRDSSIVRINDPRKNIFEPKTAEDEKLENCTFVEAKVNGWYQVFMITSKDIFKGDDLCVYYGSNYGLDLLRLIEWKETKQDAAKLVQATITNQIDGVEVPLDDYYDLS